VVAARLEAEEPPDGIRFTADRLDAALGDRVAVRGRALDDAERLPGGVPVLGAPLHAFSFDARVVPRSGAQTASRATARSCQPMPQVLTIRGRSVAAGVAPVNSSCMVTTSSRRSIPAS